jgi:undecaprenyl diphosphate synthase
MRENLEEFIDPGSEEEKLLDELDLAKLPRHIAVIMDGNGRWANLRNLPREEGHKAGAKSVQEVVEICARLGIEYLTLYAFSKENWKRPKNEVSMLWRLLERNLREEQKVLTKNQLRLKVIGQIDDLPTTVRRELRRVEKLTKDFKRMTIVLALNYGGRAEIIDAVKKLCEDNSTDMRAVDEEKFSKYLYTSDIPDPDLLIRTSGEMRISNFLLWQIAYSEIWITQELWPDFRKKHLLQALVDFQKRERRFGDIHPR